MKKRNLAITGLAAAILLAGCDGPQAGEPVVRTEIGKGSEEMMAARKALSPCRVVVFEEVPLTHCVAEPGKHVISTALSDISGKPYRSLKRYAESLGDGAVDVAFAVNGGMFDGEGEPVGYYVENSQRLEELNQNDGPGNFHLKPNGVFFGSAGKWQVKTSDEFYRTVGDRPEFGTQSGPMLVINGRLHPEIQDDGPSKAIRNGVGVDKEGRAHFVTSEAPLSFGQLARFFRDELKVPDALFLDGNISAVWDPLAERIDTGAALGPLIVVTNRSKPKDDKAGKDEQ